MCEVHREQHPLLGEEASSEDERRPPRAPPRARPRTRAAAVKGAAAIIRTWPDHWMSLVLYFWIVLAMISITTFIFYNSLTFVMMKPTSSKIVSQLRPMISSKLHLFDRSSVLNEIIMPVIVKDYQEVDINKNILPYIQIISKQYEEYQYKLLIILNDTNADMNVDDSEINNISSELFDENHKQILNNVLIEKTTLSRFMSDSPLKKVWKQLPDHYMAFLVRAVSIWEKGGISYNPFILTPSSPNPLYIKKLHRYLEKHQKQKTKNLYEKGHLPKITRRLNNIRDIIDALEKGDDSIIQNNLIEEENKVSEVTDPADIIPNFTTKAKMSKLDVEVTTKQNSAAERQMHHNVTVSDSNNKTSPSSLFPTFLEFLFREKPRKLDQKNIQSKVVVIDQQGATNVLKKGGNRSKYSKNEVADVETGGEDVDEFVLTIDLQGELVATHTPCHAFLGGLFTDLGHYSDTETLTDFIIKELTIFCKGILASCKAIDIIII